jgi:hypothetical protein
MVLLPTFTTEVFVKIARQRMAAGAANARTRALGRYNPQAYTANESAEDLQDMLMQVAGLEKSQLPRFVRLPRICA